MYEKQEELNSAVRREISGGLRDCAEYLETEPRKGPVHIQYRFEDWIPRDDLAKAFRTVAQRLI